MTILATKFTTFLSVVAVLNIQIAMAQQAGLEAHVHGVSELNIAIEGNELEMQLRSPAMNIVGFEHKANTTQHIEKVKESESFLKNHRSLFSFSNGACTLSKAEIDLSSLIAEAEGHSDAHDHHDHEDEHQDTHSGHEDEHDEHSEIVANYHYDCEDIDELSTLTLGFFDVFPAMQEIHGVWLTEIGQGAASLSGDNKVIKFK